MQTGELYTHTVYSLPIMDTTEELTRQKVILYFSMVQADFIISGIFCSFLCASKGDVVQQ